MNSLTLVNDFWDNIGDLFSSNLSHFKNDFRTLNSFELKDGKYVLSVHVPVVGDSIKLSVEDGLLTITWNEKTKNLTTSGSYSYSIPEDADVDTVDAYSEGEVVTVTFNKKVETEQPTLGKKKLGVSVR